MAEIIRAEVEAACKLLEKNGFYGVLAEASSNGVAMVGKGSNIAININSVIGNNISNSGGKQWRNHKPFAFYYRGAK